MVELAKTGSANLLAGRPVYLGLFTVTLSTLMYEILLTRIFSVTIWYHFAFLAVSIALFGMTVGAIVVYLLPPAQGQTRSQLALSSLLFGISVVVSFVAYLRIPMTMGEFTYLTLTYLTIAIPFIFSGVCVSLALTRFPRQIGKLYAADLAGAACGCVLVISVLQLTDGPGAVVVVALLGSVGAVFFAAGEWTGRPLKMAALASALLLAIFAAAHAVRANEQLPLLRLTWVKGAPESRALYEKWNSFSRIRVFGMQSAPFGWGLSPAAPAGLKVNQLALTIDASALTVLTRYDGNVAKLAYLKYDVTNVVHYLRHDAKVLTIGAGGGRDVLSALAFGQKAVVAVEINGAIIDAVNGKFGDFTGHLDRDRRVTFINDEARSYIARQKGTFDIIQASLVDTWAATAAGAFALSENSLYTVEAWRLFLEHLSPRGILSFSRWYAREDPAQMYRLTSLARSALESLGVQNPRAHMIIVRSVPKAVGIGTLLVSRVPFSAQDVDTIRSVARTMRFDVVLSPWSALDPRFAFIASGGGPHPARQALPLNTAAPTDDSPFFFQMLQLRDVFNWNLWTREFQAISADAVFILGMLLIAVFGLTLAAIIVPLLLTTRRGALWGSSPLFVFFGSIGLGFLLVEISQLERLVIFLGHPTYSLSVVLFTLLLSSGLGSYLTPTLNRPDWMTSAILRLILLPCVVFLFGMLTPSILASLQGAATPVRIAAALGILFPLGIFMGAAFPLGMGVASARFASVTPWLWGINGAASVCASVLAVAIAVSAGISVSFWTGCACYVVALIAFVWQVRSEQSAQAKTSGWGSPESVISWPAA
jgi:hypothetical protein